MDNSYIEHRIEKFDTEPSFWYQKIRLGSCVTPGRTNPEEKWNKLIGPNLPLPVQGKSVLDVGCNAGAISLRCLNEGAANVTGVEVDNIFRAQAEFVYYTNNPKAFRMGYLEIEKSIDKVKGKFDLAFLFNVLYWVGWNTQLDEGNPETPPKNGAKVLTGFLRKLSFLSRTAYVIGANQQYAKRRKLGQFTGGTTLKENVKYLEKDWVVNKAYEDNSYKRNHCIIWCTSRNYDKRN